MLTTDLSSICRPVDALDEADRALIAALCQDPRASGRDLARLASVSEANVSRRLARLQADGTVRFRAFVPPELVGVESLSLVFIDTRADAKEPATRLAKLPYIHFVATVAGSPLIIAAMACASGEQALERIDASIATIPEVACVRMLPMLHFYTPNPVAGATVPPKAQLPEHRARRGLDPTDRSILLALQRNGRATYSDLADSSGISPTAAAERFRRLQRDGIARLICAVDPSQFGKSLTAIFRVQCSGPVRPLAATLGELGDAQYMCLLGGDWQIAFESVLANEAQAHALRQQVEALPQVRRVEVHLLRAILKEVFDWGAD